ASELTSKILQYCSGLKDRNRFTSGAFRVHYRRHPVIGRDFQEVWLELLALAVVHVFHFIGNAEFLKHDRDLPAIGCRPVVKLDGRCLCRHQNSPNLKPEQSTGGQQLPANWSKGFVKIDRK